MVTARKASESALYFDKPTVTDRLYVTRGPSGWAESFQRKKLDGELARFLGAAPIEAAVDAFIIRREIDEDRRHTTWPTVLGFLARLIDGSPLDVPLEVGIAFWGRVELELRTRGASR